MSWSVRSTIPARRSPGRGLTPAAAARPAAEPGSPMTERGGDRARRVHALLVAGTVAAIMAVQAGALLVEGHPAICKCGYVKLWEGAVNSAGNSQHLTDWYSF